MLVLRFWAEHKEKCTHKRKRYTVRRFGWSNESFDKAMEHVIMRVKEARLALAAGTKWHGVSSKYRITAPMVFPFETKL